MKARSIRTVLEKKRSSPHSRILVLTGARQTGKTTLARQCFPAYRYLSIEDPVLRQDYARLTAAQWKESYPKAILDEVQKEPGLIESIKSVYDQYPEPRYLLLGSSQLLLLRKVKESLAGRCLIHEIYPLTIPEIRTPSWDSSPALSVFQQTLLNGSVPDLPSSFRLDPGFADKEKTFRYYLSYGGYPALVDPALTDDDRDEWLVNYVSTYLERDIRDLADFRALEPFVRAQQTTAALTGQLVNYSGLATECGISPKTAARFIQYLEISYQTILLPPWSRNSLKRLVKSPKLHYLDPGVQKAILRKKGGMTGHEFESAVIGEMFKQAKVSGAPATFYHLRTLDGREVDLLVETPAGFYAIEVKMAARSPRPDLRHFRTIGEILDKPLLHSFLITNDPVIRTGDGNVTVLPAALWLG